MLTRSMGAGFTGRLRPERVFDMQLERNWTDGFKIAESDFAVLFGFGGGNVNNK